MSLETLQLGDSEILGGRQSQSWLKEAVRSCMGSLSCFTKCPKGPWAASPEPDVVSFPPSRCGPHGPVPQVPGVRVCQKGRDLQLLSLPALHQDRWRLLPGEGQVLRLSWGAACAACATCKRCSSERKHLFFSLNIPPSNQNESWVSFWKRLGEQGGTSERSQAAKHVTSGLGCGDEGLSHVTSCLFYYQSNM